MLQSSSRGGLPGPGGCLAVPGGVCLVLGGVCLVPGGGSPCPGGFSLPRGEGGCLETHPPPVDRITDTCKNITLATTSLRPVIILRFVEETGKIRVYVVQR